MTEKTTIRVIIAGSRSFDDYKLLRESADRILLEYQNSEIEIVSGHARGADSLGEQYAKERGYRCSVFPAQWKQHGVRAGFLRNSQMISYASEKEPLVIAFWDGISHGTKDTIDKCRTLHVEHHVICFKEKTKD